MIKVIKTLLVAGLVICSAQLYGRGDSNKKEIIVAVLDSGVDTTNINIKGMLLKGKSGYKGWNFLGDKEGLNNPSSVGKECFRVMQSLHSKYSSLYDLSKDSTGKPQSGDDKEFAKYISTRQKSRIDQYLGFAAMLEARYRAFKFMDSVIVSQKGNNNIALSDLSKIDYSMIPDTANPKIDILSQECMKFSYKGISSWKKSYEIVVDEYELSVKRVASIGDIKSNPRFSIGDNPYEFFTYKRLKKAAPQKQYGNGNIMCEDYQHGTAICEAFAESLDLFNKMDVVKISNNKQGMKTLPEQDVKTLPEHDVKILPVRVVSQGDPFDKDLSSAIIYSVNMGAKVILIPMAKDCAMYGERVDEAINYAGDMDVLVIAASGDWYTELLPGEIYPMAMTSGYKTYKNFIRVGASDFDKTKNLKSNFSPLMVDFFAQGGAPKGNIFTGSDHSAAVTAACAAIIRSINPKMGADEVKELLCKSVEPMTVTKYNLNKQIIELKPEILSVTGGVLNPKGAFETLTK